MSLEFIRPDWTAPAGIRAVSTLRPGGASPAPWASLNLGHHVGDDPDRVAENRRRVREALGLREDPVWLEQVHGTTVLRMDDDALPKDREADGATTSRPGRALVVLTADCLPVLMCRRDGQRVGVAHAGWRGLAAGVIEAAVGSMDADPRDLAIWLGPSIGPGAYEVGDEVRQTFAGRDPASAGFFRPGRPGHWQFDLPGLARRRAESLGIAQVYGGQWCTFSDRGRFFSHRRDGPCGRMATLVWIGG